jgi:3-isopropylmalate/(R)-2-methylmalate dehydratase large subunit
MGKTITEKIFDAHRVDEPFKGTQVLKLDVVMCHEITTPVAIADLEARGKDRVFDNTKIKAVIDHVTPAKDSKSAIQGKMLREWAARHGIKDFYTVIMGDSHTCTHGAFGAFAAGIGTTDLEVGILKGVCAFRQPSTIKVVINGTRTSGVYAKDIILEIIRTLTVNGATDRVIEFTGAVVDAMSMEERMTLSNMAIEAGGTTGICMPDAVTVDYLWPFVKDEFGNDKARALAAYKKWWSDPDAEYEKTITIDASAIEPVATVGFKPDQVRKLSDLSKENVRVNQIYIGSCTNGRISDLREAARVVKGTKLAPGVRGVLSPATPAIYRQALDEGLIALFMEAGYCVTNPTCGACLGMSNGVLAEGEACASTTNRNFNGRMGKGGMVHLMSPASAAAAGVAGRLVDPRGYIQ